MMHSAGPTPSFALALLLVCSLLSTCVPENAARADDSDFNYLVGRGIADVTGPSVGVQMWGFVREGQTTEGIHFRLRSRAFVIAQRDARRRIALATVDVGSVTHELFLTVIEALRAKYGDLYGLDNVIISKRSRALCSRGDGMHRDAESDPRGY